MKKKNKKVCFIASSGGHLVELQQLNKVFTTFDSYYVVAKSKSTSNSKEFKYSVWDFNRKNILLTLLTFMITSIQQFIIFIKEKPDYVITSGPGMVIPTCYLAALLKKRIIFIESFARISTPSKTGIKLYNKADLFLIQNEQLKEFYPNAIYGGGVF